MNNQQLLDNAPEGATHVDTEGDYHKIETIYQYEDKSDCGYEDRFRLSNSGDWVTDSDDLLLTRSLADIKRIAELENQWISVEDRLPDSDYQNVLAFCDGGNIQTTKFHSDRFAFKRLGWPKSNCYTRKLLGKLSGHFMLSHDSGYKVTHWMPLPEPPKERGE